MYSGLYGFDQAFKAGYEDGKKAAWEIIMTVATSGEKTGRHFNCTHCGATDQVDKCSYCGSVE